MKKLLALLWLLIYTCVSTGFAVSTHFCMDKPQAVALGAVKQDVCAKCGMHKGENNGCCRDEIKVLKLQQDTRLAKLLLPSFETTVPIAALSPFLLSPFYNFAEADTLTAFQPPPLPGSDRCVTNCVFRI